MYTALYRKWRPFTFDDVISQPHITDTLRNQIRSSRTAHAYLFTGSRGTGKTTCARILAKAVNCLNQKDGNPCLECEICRNAERSSLTDITEIDAASNNSVDDVRDLRENILYTPEICKFKIYIIDEVHMLSQSAFNALLKIMEEPPEYVKFILATTEIHKVPATILSRCQRFDFRRINSDDISERLLYIASEENITLEKSASQLIARLSDGGMRDAVSLLDRCWALSDNITDEIVSSASGTAGKSYVFDIINAITEKNTAHALSVINALHSMSKDMQRLCDEISVQLRNIMLIKSGISDSSVLICTPDEMQTLKNISENTDMNRILYCISSVQDCISRMSRCINKRTEIEMCIIKLCTSAVKIQENIVDVKPAVQHSAKKSAVNPEDCHQLKNWADIVKELSKINPAVCGSLSGSTAIINEKANSVFIIAKNPFFMMLFKNNEKNKKDLEFIINQFLGITPTIYVKCEGSPDNENHNALKLIEKADASGIPVEQEI